MLLKFLKPSPLKLGATVLFVLWVYFYTLQVFAGPLIEEALYLIREGVGLTDWGSAGLMRTSYAALWIFVAMIVFFILIVFDRVYTFLHNRMVLKGYVKKSANPESLVKKAETAVRHEKYLIYWAGVLLLFYFGLFYLSGWLVTWFDLYLSIYFLELPESYQVYTYLFLLIPVYYGISCLISYLVSVEKTEQAETELLLEHDATKD